MFGTSCTYVKNFTANKPFVFDNKVILNGQIDKEDRKQITFEINNYWDDSLKALKAQQFGLFYKLKNPPSFDSTKIASSKIAMNAFLNSKGYYYAQLTPSFKFDTLKSQIRTFLTMQIDIGKAISIDSVNYQFSDATLQNLANQQQNFTLLRKGSKYSKQLISSELDRLINYFKRNGYYKLQREDLYALVDTLDKNILNLTFNSFEQAQLIANIAKQRANNPQWDVSIKQKLIQDSTKLLQYHIGKIYYYPEFSGLQTTESLLNDSSLKWRQVQQMIIKYQKGKFKFKPLREHTYLQNGALYNEDNIYKTVNTLGRLGAWTGVDYLLKIRDKDSLDVHLFLNPAMKQSFTVGLEGSRNTGDIGSGNLLGLATNITYTNRNVWKQAIQSLTTFRTGVEFNIDQQQSNNTNNFLQTVQTSISHNYSFPRLILPGFVSKNNRVNKYISKLDNKRTLIGVSAAYTNRKEFYELRNLVTSFGYEFTKNNNLWTFRPINIELFAVDTLQGLIDLFNQNPFLRNSFRNGNVVGSSIGWSRTFSNGGNLGTSHYLRFGAEESGTLVSLLSKSLSERVFDYIKLEGEYRYLNKFKRGDELAARIFTGIGVPLKNESMPVFKQYFLGGPNSMRAWGLRQLGLGSSKASDTTTSGYTDRFGDLVMEANLEYRFPLITFSAVKISSALYADVGNVWSSHKSNNTNSATLSLNNLTRDLAIGVGTGLRFDFNYFLFRLDFAYKVKDPVRNGNNGWMSVKNFEWVNIRENRVAVKNFAFQFGIGLPF